MTALLTAILGQGFISHWRKWWRIYFALFGIVVLIAGTILLLNSYTNRRIAQTSADLDAVDKAVAEERISKDAIDTEIPKKEAYEARKHTNKALKELDAARDKDSSEYNEKVDAAINRFCSLYPQDSVCVGRPK